MAGDVFIDILPRMSMSAVDKILADVKRAFSAGGAEAGKSLSKGFDTGLADLSRNAELAFRDVDRAMAQLDAAQADRVAAFKRGADEMVNAERRVQAAIAETNRALSASREADAAVMAGGSRGRPTERKPRTIIDRAGPVAALGSAAVIGYGVDVDLHAQSNMNQIMRQQVGMPNAESRAGIDRLTQFAYQNAGQLGPSSSVQNLTQALQQAEQAGYRGQNAINIVQTAFKEATVTGAGFQETLSALNTQLRDTHEQSDKLNASLAQMQQISSQNVRAFGQVNLTPEERSQMMNATHSYEPTLTALSPNAKPSDVLAQAQAAMVTLMRTGMPADQAAQNLSHFFQTLNLQPGSKAWQAFGQIGGNQQDLSLTLQNEGPIAAFQKIQDQMAKATGPNGLINSGYRFNNQQLQDLAQNAFNNMSDEEKAFISAHPDISQGLASPMSLRKAVDSGQLTGPGDAQDILAYSRWQAQLTGLNPNVKKGGPVDLTPTQLVQAMFGNADTSRTFDILNQAGQDLTNRLNSILSGGKQNVLEDSFKQALSGDTAARWHALGDTVGSVAGELANTFMPEISGAVNGLKGFANFLQNNQGAAKALADVMLDIAAAWGAAKIKDMFVGIGQSLGLLSDSSKVAATKVATMGVEAETAGAEMAGSGLGGALKGAAANVAAAFAPAALATLLGVQIANAVDHSQALKNFEQNNPLAQNPVSNWINQHTPSWLGGNPGWQNPSLPATSVPPTAPNSANAPTVGGIPIPGLLPGHAKGGIVDQPLLGQPDTGGDSILGMVNGSPVGLRGGEGILTPEAVAALGGEDGVNALNSNPWANPFKVATTFYGSFAKGVAKYSPFGKYLTAAGQSLDSLEQASEDAQKTQTRSDQQMLKALLGSSPYGSYRGHRGSASYGGGSVGSGNADTMHAIAMAAADMGLDQSQYDAVKWIFSHESGFDPTISNGGGHGAPSNNKAYGLGQFLGHMGDKYGQMGAYSGDPGLETKAAIQYMIDRYGSPAAAKAYWQTHGNYATGGVIPLSPPKRPVQPPKPSGPSTHPSTPPRGPHRPNQPKPRGTNEQRQSGLDVVLNTMGQVVDKANPASGDRNIKANPSQQLTAEGKGFSAGGGLMGIAESAATMAANAFAPGSGQAAQMGFQLLNRAIGYGGQLLGIGMEGLMETFLPNDSPAADPSKNLFGKIALGIAGAHPGGNNLAGSHAKSLQPKKDLDQGAMQAKQQPGGHTFNFGDVHNHDGAQDLTKAVNHAMNIGYFAGI